jgi:hypothetical protein
MHECKNARMHGWRKPTCAFVHLCICALLVSGCFRARAQTTPDMPPLDVPLPPPRLVEAAETEPPEPATLMQEPARTPVPVRPTPAQQTEGSKPEPPRTDGPADLTKPIEARTPASTTLGTTPTAQEGEVERRIRGLLLEATGNLNRIDYGRLNADAKVQYDAAKSFVRQAEEALKNKNLVFASYLADKAATLAAQLRGR